MSDIEYFSKVNSQPFVSMAKEEGMRIEEIKKRIQKEKSRSQFSHEQKHEPELTYERDVLNDYE